jgi:hypothetical protein
MLGRGRIALPSQFLTMNIKPIASMWWYPTRKRPSDLVVFARLVDNKVIIEEDFSDKPLVDKLLRRGIPREQVVLIYQGESYANGAIPNAPAPSGRKN